ncbi:MAG: MaoC family dehydratase [Usitatibacteraceae bacterium]
MDDTASRPLTGYFFEHYRVGQKFHHATPRTITQGDVALYQALTGSRLPLHCSEPFAQSLGYPSMPVDDLLVFHIAFGKTVPDVSYNAVANLGYADCRFLQPVFIGDTLRTETEIQGLKENSSGKTGVVYVRSNCFNQRNEMVLTWIRWVMVHRAKPTDNPSRDAQGVIDAPGQVAEDAIVVPAYLACRSDISTSTGSKKYWEDFAASDTSEFKDPPAAGMTPWQFDPIKHPAGMTIDETDHTLATKLYQNTARVHFDLHHMKDSRFGRRLVYGGQVISICRALSYDGLENALSIAAINSGSHDNPTFAGDTLFAVSVPVMKWPINKDIGALRLHLYAYKNVDPNSEAFATAPAELKVLSLDYTVLMPRRPK